jgi:hypothetical protein
VVDELVALLKVAEEVGEELAELAVLLLVIKELELAVLLIEVLKALEDDEVDNIEMYIDVKLELVDEELLGEELDELDKVELDKDVELDELEPDVVDVPLDVVELVVELVVDETVWVKAAAALAADTELDESEA